jgi:REP element-mobilizing transposase RayT
MKYNPEKNHRRSIRLKGYDYSQQGGYYMTIVTQNRECLFGYVADGKMVLNDAGTMIEKWYFELENKFTDIQCDKYIVMPNHFHAIIYNVGADLCVCPINKSGEHHSGEHHSGEHIGSPLPKIIQWFKTMATNEYIRGVNQNGWQPFNGKLWQRNYWEHIIRDENELNHIREYIINNPLKWESDDENPNRL